MGFSIDPKGLAFLLAILLLGLFLKKKFFASSIPPHLLFSNLKAFSLKNRLQKWQNFSSWCFKGAFILFSIALLDPHKMVPKAIFIDQPPKEGIAIYLDLDRSGSMSEQVEVYDNKISYYSFIPKIELLKQVTKQFIGHHPSDLIGIVGFARIPQVLSPLTFDQNNLQDKLDHFTVVSTKEEDGTSIGYAIYKTAHLIASTLHYAQQGGNPYEIKNAIIVAVTDGFQDPNPLDYENRLRTVGLEEAAAYAKSQNIKLYVINIDPAFLTEKFAPHRRLFEKITQITGGKFFVINNQQDLSAVYATIDSLEKGPIRPQEKEIRYSKMSFYPIFIFAGLLLLLTAFLFDSTLLRTVP